MNIGNLILFNLSDTSNSASTKDIQNSSDQKLLYLGRSCVGYHTGKNIWIRGLIHRLLPQCATKTRFWYRETDVMKQAFVYFLNIIISCYVFSPSLWLGTIQVLRHHVFDFFRPTQPPLTQTRRSLLSKSRVFCKAS